MIPLLDLRAQYTGIKAELDAAVLETLASGAYVSGPKVDAFEKSFAAYTHAKEAVALNSGTSALHLALHLRQRPLSRRDAAASHARRR